MKKTKNNEQPTFNFSLAEIVGYQEDGEYIREYTVFSIKADNYEEACDKAFDYADSHIGYDQHDSTLYDNDGNALWDYDEARCEWEYAG